MCGVPEYLALMEASVRVNITILCNTHFINFSLDFICIVFGNFDCQQMPAMMDRTAPELPIAHSPLVTFSDELPDAAARCN